MNSFRFKLVWLTLLLLLSVCGVMVLRSDSAKPRIVSTLTTRGVSENGAVLITPTEGDFKLEASLLISGKDQRLKSLIEAGLPFSVFVRNTTNEDIVGCSLEWRIEKPDGTTTTIGQSYSSPGVLTGLRPSDPAMVGRTSLVNAKASGFFALDADQKESVDRLTTSAPGARMLIVDSDFEGLINHLRSLQRELIEPGSTITVTIDGLIFSDGAFFGPDKNRLIVSMKALVKAKGDLGRIIEQQAKAYTNPDVLFRRVVALTEKPPLSREVAAAPDSEFHQLYVRYWKISVDELISIRDARGSAEAIKYSQQAFHRDWPSLHASETNNRR